MELQAKHIKYHGGKAFMYMKSKPNQKQQVSKWRDASYEVLDIIHSHGNTFCKKRKQYVYGITYLKVNIKIIM